MSLKLSSAYKTIGEVVKILNDELSLKKLKLMLTQSDFGKHNLNN